jgi:hypothetical protein
MTTMQCQKVTGKCGVNHFSRNAMDSSNFKEQNALKVVLLRKGCRIHDTLTLFEYKEDNGTFLKRKAGRYTCVQKTWRPCSSQKHWHTWHKALAGRPTPDDGIYASRTGWSRMDTLKWIVIRLFHEALGFWFIIPVQGLFVDNMMHVPTCARLHNELMRFYQKSQATALWEHFWEWGWATRQGDQSTSCYQHSASSCWVQGIQFNTSRN